jgi:hypothetical protein
MKWFHKQHASQRKNDGCNLKMWFSLIQAIDKVTLSYFSCQFPKVDKEVKASLILKLKTSYLPIGVAIKIQNK